MSTFQRGQKSKLEDLTPATKIEVGVSLGNPRGLDIDVSCFGLDEAGKLSDDRYFIFYNQPKSPCGGVAMETRGGFDKIFDVDLSRLPGNIKKLVFAATIDGGGEMSQISGSELVVLANGQPVMTFPFDGSIFSAEKAVMIGEIYFKSVWRVAAVGQGFNGGLQALLESFGGEVADKAGRRAGPPGTRARAGAGPRAGGAKIKLGKVTLDKRGDSQKISLKKGPSATPIHINLNWDQGQEVVVEGSTSADLDLGCMFEMQDGLRGVIQPLGNRFGSRHQEPFILLDKDDRSGASTDGENMTIFRPDLIKRVVVFAMIYEGTANFTTVNGRVTLKDSDGNEITVFCNAPDSRLTFCAVTLIENTGTEIKFTKEERYFPSHKQCDEHYGFGFRWVAGSK